MPEKLFQLQDSLKVLELEGANVFNAQEILQDIINELEVSPKN